VPFTVDTDPRNASASGVEPSLAGTRLVDSGEAFGGGFFYRDSDHAGGGPHPRIGTRPPSPRRSRALDHLTHRRHPFHWRDCLSGGRTLEKRGGTKGGPRFASDQETGVWPARFGRKVSSVASDPWPRIIRGRGHPPEFFRGGEGAISRTRRPTWRRLSRRAGPLLEFRPKGGSGSIPWATEAALAGRGHDRRS